MHGSTRVDRILAPDGEDIWGPASTGIRIDGASPSTLAHDDAYVYFLAHHGARLERVPTCFH